jgi:hypothetical protein
LQSNANSDTLPAKIDMPESHEFELLTTAQIDELRTRARLFRHTRTGAELLSLENDDENKVFGITFRTPPADSTGVAHILEHSVLCGSRKYPVKEPFVELLKGSLQTFLNAFTYPDRTCYPVASQNLRDFHNLIDVYMDATLYPLLAPTTHAQEAWHYDIEKPGDPLVFKGVVFNEMKGVYSSPDSVLGQAAQESLFPDITYGLDSGGHPEHIPDLTHEQLLAFHRKFYHPSNARIFFHGDDDPADRLRRMAEWLKPFDRLDVDSAIPRQAPFREPRRLARAYHATEGSPARAMAVLSWLLEESTDPEFSIAAEILGHLLIGTPSSPLRKALIESGLGEDLAGIGLENQLRQFYFSTGLKGIRAEDAPRVEELILSTVRALAEKGIDPRTVDASVNTIEFRLRENNSGSFPRGLSLMIRSLGSWLYGGSPIAALAFEEPLRRIKAGVGSGYFEKLLRRFLVDNPHRVALVLTPDPRVGPAAEAREKARLETARAKLTTADLRRLVDQTHELRKLQITPDPPESLALLPRLALRDLPARNKSIPREETAIAGTPTLYHDLFTQGVVYLDLGFDLQQLSESLLPFAPLWGRALLEMGTRREDFVSLGQRIGSRTGGITHHIHTSPSRGGRRDAAWLFLRGKALEPNVRDLTGILHDVLTEVRLDLRDRFRQIVLEEKASLEASLVPSGSMLVNLRLRRGTNLADAAAERTRGISYLYFLRGLADRIERDWPAVLQDLREVHARLANRPAMVANLTGHGSARRAAEEAVEELLRPLPSRAVYAGHSAPSAAWSDEGLAIPAQVNYVGMGLPVTAHGRGVSGSDLVIARHLRGSYLWERVRVQGGAYGGYCLLDPRSGYLTLLSYRDPQLERTLEMYRGIPSYLEALVLDEDELTKAVVGAIGDFDQHLLPDAKGFTDLGRWLIGEDAEFRQRLRNEVLATRADAVVDFAHRMKAGIPAARVAVLGDEAALKRAGRLSIQRVL